VKVTNSVKDDSLLRDGINYNYNRLKFYGTCQGCQCHKTVLLCGVNKLEGLLLGGWSNICR
jgi:hypothetical protein